MTDISADGISRRGALTAGGAALLCATMPSPAGAEEETLTPEMFGAKGDGVTNDSVAFEALAQAVSRRGGGTIALARKTYIVGLQRPSIGADAGYAFAPAPLLHFRGLAGPLVIEGNGAVLRCAPGGRYGTFDRATGTPKRHPMPYYALADRATPYDYMISVEGSAGPVTIQDIELDGNLPHLVIGGEYGDTGIQIAGTGVYLKDNKGSELLRNVHSHHHPQDGLIIDGLDDPALAKRTTRRAENVRCEYNGRQGLSLVGGRGWTFSQSRFSHTGRAGIGSNPGAGVDIEAEGGKTNRNHVFLDCELADNIGCGLVADSGDSADVSFERCRFIGTTMWSAWPDKPGFRFRGCTFVGSLVHAYGDPNPARAAQFYDCLFTDDPRQSPNRKVYREGRADGSIADLGDTVNVRFERCRFEAVGGAVLPWSTGVIYANCTMRQTTASVGYPRGTYVGRNTINGAVSLYGVKIPGELILNGKPFRP
jgi:hypothetical protein